MRTQRTLRGSVMLPLASLLAATMLVPFGCKQVEDLTAKVKGEPAKDESAEAKDESAEAGKEAAEPEEKSADPKVDPTPVAEAEIEAVPVEEHRTGLDLMLKLVPNDQAEFMIARDATVAADYIEEAMLFVDGPIDKLTHPETGSPELAGELSEVITAYRQVAAFQEKLRPALETSGLQPKEGMAIIKDNGASYIVFNAEDPTALRKFAEAIDPSKAEDASHCQAIEGMAGWNVCAKADADLAKYKPSEDPTALRATMTALIPGVDLEQANLVMHIKSDGEPFDAAVSTIPGSMHVAIAAPPDNDGFRKVRESLSPGPAKTLSNVMPGAGFVWAHVNPAVLEQAVNGMGGDAPPPAKDFVKAMTGDFVLAGSVDPGGMVLQAGLSDATSFAGLLALGDALKGEAPKEIPEFGNAKLTVEKVTIEGGGNTTEAMHVGLAGIAEADVLKSYTGLHMDGWAFASGDVFTLALGPDAEGIGKLMVSGGAGPSEALLAALPTDLADGLRKNEVSMAVHLPMDFMHGKQLIELATATLKEVPDADPSKLLPALSLLAPFSSASVWLSQPGDKVVLHMSVQGIGNRETEEGKVALLAARAVVDGASPEAEFGPIAAKFGASPMAYAYKARAGTEGPGYMIGSGVGAAMATALVAVPVALGKANLKLAEDLGVKPDDPEPVVVEPTVPKKPKVTKKPAEPKKPVEPKPAVDPVEPTKPTRPTRPATDDPAKPIVEPVRPLPPKPTPDAPKPTRTPIRRPVRK